jgi:hypothetical protein
MPRNRLDRHAYGGNDAADLALGRSAWRAIVNLLRLAYGNTKADCHYEFSIIDARLTFSETAS